MVMFFVDNDVDIPIRPRGRIDLKHPERMARDIRSHLLKKEEQRHSELIQKELDELKDCTFNPHLPPNSFKNRSNNSIHSTNNSNHKY